MQKITISWVLEFVDWTLHENHENWYPTKFKPSTVFEEEKGESVEIGDVDFHKKSCCVEKFTPKRDGEQTSENNTECML